MSLKQLLALGGTIVAFISIVAPGPGWLLAAGVILIGVAVLLPPK